MTDDDVEYLTRPDPACPLCLKTTCPHAADPRHICEGWEVKTPEEEVYILRDHIRAYWPYALLAAVFVACLIVGSLT